MEEIWKPIRNHENFYLVSNLGRVKRLSAASKRKDGKNYKRPEKILKPYKNKKGYLITIMKNKDGTISFSKVFILATSLPIGSHHVRIETVLPFKDFGTLSKN